MEIEPNKQIIRGTFLFWTPLMKFKILHEAYIEELLIKNTTGKDRIIRTSLLFLS